MTKERGSKKPVGGKHFKKKIQKKNIFRGNGGKVTFGHVRVLGTGWGVGGKEKLL